jgi:hypothetical protein
MPRPSPDHGRLDVDAICKRHGPIVLRANLYAVTALVGASVVVIGQGRHQWRSASQGSNQERHQDLVILVPLSWSMIPAMNKDALNVAWFMMWKMAATSPSVVSALARDAACRKE